MVWLADLDRMLYVLAHEIGHNQGLRHVECPEDPGQPPFEEYPYADGRIGVTGFGVVDEQLREGDGHYNYMSYCGQGLGAWASDWDWARNWDTIVERGQQGRAAQATPVIRASLSGGEGRWWLARDTFDPVAAGEGQSLSIESDGRTLTVPARADSIADGSGVWLTAPVPPGVVLDGARVRALVGEREIGLHAFELPRRPPSESVGAL
jgi:hypothetical protein